jgi:hypothetical protein
MICDIYLYSERWVEISFFIQLDGSGEPTDTVFCRRRHQTQPGIGNLSGLHDHAGSVKSPQAFSIHLRT